MDEGEIGSGHLQPGAILSALDMQAVTVDRLDAVLEDVARPALTILFLWGRNCPNCDIAKAEMTLAPGRFRWPDVGWLQCNVYDDPEMATRFGLHGIPVFLVFRGKRSIGRITSWPGTAAFVSAIERQRAQSGAA